MIDALIKRNTPELSERFLCELVPPREDGKNFYSVGSHDGKVLLRGDDRVSLAAAYFSYLVKYCGAYFSFDRVLKTQSDAPLPEEEYVHVIEQKYRMCLDYPFFACNACWWDWNRWEREIDYMAMNGVNLPLSVVGTEAVWVAALKEFKYGEPAAIATVSGPSFWPWQLRNNFDGYIPQVGTACIENRQILGRKIIEREKELDMKPVMQGFSGYVPRSIISVQPRIMLKKSDPWNKFGSVHIISPRDKMFRRFSQVFLEKQKLLLGESDFYCADPFFEMKPPVKKSTYPVSVSTAIYRSFEAFNENSVWVIHSESAIESMVKAVPKQRILIVDSDGTGCAATDGFWGYPFISGIAHNSNGVNTIHGDLKALASESYEKLRGEYPQIAGKGVFSDAPGSNFLYSGLAMHMLTQPGKVDINSYISEYSSAKYGEGASEAEKALDILANNRKDEAGKREHGSMICTRPTTKPLHTSPFDSGLELADDGSSLFKCANMLLNSGGSGYDFELDVCDILRQALSDRANVLCKNTIESYHKRDAAAFEINSNAFLTLLEDMDSLLRTKQEFDLDYYLAEVRKNGTSEEEKQNFEINMLSMITIFGPMRDTSLFDSCWREWSGLITTYYAMRWRALFESMATSFKKRSNVIAFSRHRFDGRDEYLGCEFFRGLAKFEKNWIAVYKERDGERPDTLETAKALIEKYI